MFLKILLIQFLCIDNYLPLKVGLNSEQSLGNMIKLATANKNPKRQHSSGSNDMSLMV
jgi:hypothetical protein